MNRIFTRAFTFVLLLTFTNAETIRTGLISEAKAMVGGAAIPNALPEITFEEWQAQHFTEGQLGNFAISGPTSAPLGDGVANMVKFLLGIDPWSSASGLLPTASIRAFEIDGVEREYLTLTFTRMANAVGVNHSVVTSGRLGDWTAEAMLVESVEKEDGTVTEVWRDSIPMGTEPRRFMMSLVVVPEDERKREVLEVWGSAYAGAGDAFSAVTSWEQVPEAFASAAQSGTEAVMKLRELQERGYPVGGYWVETLEEWVEDLWTAAEFSSAEDYSNTAALANAIADHIRLAAPELPATIPPAMFQAALILRAGAQALDGIEDPGVHAIFEDLYSIKAEEYAEHASFLLEMTDAELRQWLNIEELKLAAEDLFSTYHLDDPAIREGLGAFQNGEGMQHLEMLAEDLLGALRVAGEAVFLESLALFGTHLTAISTGIGGANLAFFINVWSDQCSPEGAKQNCQMVPEFNITMCGNSVEETEKVIKLSNKLPFGRAVIGAALLIQRVRWPSSIHFKCKFEICEDTICVPLVGWNLMWVEKEEWIEVTNQGQDPVGPGDCWTPQLWAPRERAAFSTRVQQVVSEQCDC